MAPVSFTAQLRDRRDRPLAGISAVLASRPQIRQRTSSHAWQDERDADGEDSGERSMAGGGERLLPGFTQELSSATTIRSDPTFALVMPVRSRCSSIASTSTGSASVYSLARESFAASSVEDAAEDSEDASYDDEEVWTPSIPDDQDHALQQRPARTPSKKFRAALLADALRPLAQLPRRSSTRQTGEVVWTEPPSPRTQQRVWAKTLTPELVHQSVIRPCPRTPPSASRPSTSSNELPASPDSINYDSGSSSIWTRRGSDVANPDSSVTSFASSVGYTIPKSNSTGRVKRLLSNAFTSHPVYGRGISSADVNDDAARNSLDDEMEEIAAREETTEKRRSVRDFEAKLAAFIAAQRSAVIQS